MHCVIEGVLIPTSQLNIGNPASGRWDWKNNRLTSDERAPQIILQETMGIVTPHEEDDIETSPRAGKRVQVPVLSANTLRNRIRKGAVDLIEEVLKERGEKLSLDAWHMLTCGSATGQPDKTTPTVAEILEAREHFFMGCFGGGARMHTGKLRVDTGWPITPDTIRAGMIEPAYHGFAVETWMMLQATMFRRDDPALSLTDERMARTVDNYREAVEEWRAFLADVPKSKPSHPAKLERWSNVQVVVPGSPFQLRYELDSANSAQIGLILLAIESFARRQFLGGRAGTGYGRFGLRDFRLRCQDLHITDLYQTVGGVCTLNDDHDFVLECLEALQEALETMSAAQLEGFATFRGEKSWPGSPAPSSKVA